MRQFVNSNLATSMVIVSWALSIVMSCIMSITMSSSTSDFMEFDTIAGIFFFSIESYICQIVPDREESGIHEIREKELIEHEDDSEWDDSILMTHDIPIVCRLPYDFLIVWSISEPGEEIPDMKYIALLHHIDTYSTKGEEEKCRYQDKNTGIERRMCRLTDDKSSMQREEYSEDEDKIDRDTDEKYRKSERKESSLSRECRVTEEDD